MITEPIYSPIPAGEPGLWGFYALLFFVAVFALLAVLHHAEKKARRRVLDENRRRAQECAQAMKRQEVAR